MKNTLSLLLIGLALGYVGLHAQTTNSGVTVVTPTSTTATNIVYTPTPVSVVKYTPAKISANSAGTGALVSTYLTPMLTSLGIVTPTGAAPRVMTVNFYNDGSSTSQVTYCDPTKLPAPPSN